MAGIKDVAKEAGLGIATVSKYIHGGNVRPENKILLDKAIEKLDYRVNTAARTLKTNKSGMIGIVVPELSNLFTTTILTEVEDKLMEKGYGVIISDCRSDKERERKCVEFLLSRQVDGIINMPVSVDGYGLQSVKDTPVVLIDRKIDGYDHVGINNEKAGKFATQLLVDAGHKKIAFIAGPKDIYTAKERFHGYKQVIEEHNIQGIYVENSDFTIESAYTQVKELLSNESGITALVASNYELTIGTIMALNEAGLKIYEDVSVVGFDNIELAKVINPTLTIVGQPIIEIASKAVDLLLEKIDGRQYGMEVILEPFVESGKSIKVIE